MSPLYQYAITKDEKRDKDDEITEPESVLVEPVTILAGSPEQAGTIASRAIPEAEMVNLDRIRVLVRPF